MELNPNHPVTSSMRDHWHKIAAILVNRIAKGRTTITADEIASLEGKAITMEETPAGIVLRIVTMEEGEKLARKEAVDVANMALMVADNALRLVESVETHLPGAHDKVE